MDTIYFDKYKMVQTLLERSCILCFKIVIIIKNNTHPHFYYQKIKKSLKTNFLFVTTILKITLHLSKIWHDNYESVKVPPSASE